MRAISDAKLQTVLLLLQWNSLDLTISASDSTSSCVQRELDVSQPQTSCSDHHLTTTTTSPRNPPPPSHNVDPPNPLQHQPARARGPVRRAWRAGRQERGVPPQACQRRQGPALHRGHLRQHRQPPAARPEAPHLLPPGPELGREPPAAGEGERPARALRLQARCHCTRKVAAEQGRLRRRLQC